MELMVVGKNFEITQSIRDYLAKKIKKLTRHLPDIDEAKVEIHEEKTKSPEHRVSVQITIKSRGTLLRSEERSANAHTAIDAVIDVLGRRIERYKAKFEKKGRGANSARHIPAVSENVTSRKDSFTPELVRIKRFTVKSMTVEDATEQMELLSHDFFLFVNGESGELNLIYRRKDGNYGLIETEIV